MTTDTQVFTPAALPIIPSMVWLSMTFIVFLTCMIFIAVLKRMSPPREKQSPVKLVLVFLIHAFKKPAILFLMGYAIYVTTLGFIEYFPSLAANQKNVIFNSALYLKRITEFIAFFWLTINLLNQGQDLLQVWLIKTHKTVTNILLPMISKSLKAAIILLMLNILIPALGFSGQMDEALAKAAKVTLILILAWLIVEIINGVENLILNQYANREENLLLSRKINTQVLLLKKVILAIVSIITLASILMVFDSVKNLGTGLLTTAGVLSALGAFASQQSLGRIFAGLQIAFTQPIRMGDTVIVDNEQGQVEEITLSYIVVKLWDLRRLILPSDYFTTRGLQNLTRTSTDLLGTVFFYTDYTLPLEPVRKEFNEILKNSKLWNGNVSSFQVTDIKENSMELRALVSAKDASTLWDLRCEVRERLMQFIIDKYPQFLSKRRNLTWKDDQVPNT
jgi:small-conductance mechanosensitive channel